MQFNSASFLLLAMPAAVIGYFLLGKLGRKPAQIFLVLGSLVLYAQGGWKGLCLLCCSIAGNGLLCLWMKKAAKGRRAILWLGILMHVGVLVAYKYLGFAGEIFGNLLGRTLQFPQFALPLGISFFTFQQISYLVDAYQGKTEGNTALDYLLYSTYFPKLIMGPIVRQDALLVWFRAEKGMEADSDRIAAGLQRFAYGLFKKVILADLFSNPATWLKVPEATSVELILAAMAYGFQIYFDFSGYTDMACGFSEMLNIRLPENFRSPYQALSMRDFWKRWHMTLTGFFTEYIYIPLGGSRKGSLRTYFNTMLVFLISGLWHGANWTFVLWGALNGALCIFDRLTEKYRKHIHPAFSWMVTFCAVNVLWILFQADSVGQWLECIRSILSFEKMSVGGKFLATSVTPALNFLFALPGFRSLWAFSGKLCVFCLFGGSLALCLGARNTTERTYAVNWRTAVWTAILLILCLTCMNGNAVFVYNGF